jgi:hypothetical protein
VDQNNGGNGVDDLINVGYESAYTYLGSTSNSNFLPLTAPYAEPAVLTVNSSGNVVLAPLSEIGSVVSPMQLWGDYLSPAQAQLKKNARSLRPGCPARPGTPSSYMPGRAGVGQGVIPVPGGGKQCSPAS